MTGPVFEARALALPDGQLVAVALRPFTAEEIAGVLEVYPDAASVVLTHVKEPTWREGYALKLHPSLEVTYTKTHWNGTTNITIKRKKDNDRPDDRED